MKSFFFASLAGYTGLATALLLPKNIPFYTKFSPYIKFSPYTKSSPYTAFPYHKAHRTPCANTATSRGCWGKYSIDTNFYEETPNTGVTREYWLNVQNTTLAPDGVERLTMNFNGSIPGPLISANWGDHLIIHVTNNLESNGTAIHWHGLRQLRNNEYDGVPGVTQCPIAPGNTKTYKFRATEYGSTWYHSHHSLQYGDGLFGPIIINGPATANYDEDIGLLTLSDWGHKSTFERWDAVQTTAIPALLENGLINGKNTYGNGGSRYETVFKPGKKYRIRIVNTAIEGHFRFAIDDHTFTVIANDLVPIVPYETDNVIISMGQRYDMIVEAKTNPTADSYWMRAIWQSTCNPNGNPEGILGIVRYKAGSTAVPTTTGPSYPDACGDEPYASLVPHVPVNAGQNGAITTLNLGATFAGVLKWTFNNSSLNLNWSDPTNLRIAKHQAVFPTDYNVYPLPNPNEWIYLAISDLTGNPPFHTIHLHGHDSLVLAQGNGTYSPSSVPLNFHNPPRRDTVTLPSGGHLVLAFKTDNPGSWLMHCHVAWHSSGGMSVQFVEREREIPRTIRKESVKCLEKGCKSWDRYAKQKGANVQIDSGI